MQSPADTVTSLCPKCGQAVRPRMARCRSCGHVLVRKAGDVAPASTLAATPGDPASQQPESFVGTYVDDILEMAGSQPVANVPAPRTAYATPTEPLSPNSTDSIPAGAGSPALPTAGRPVPLGAGEIGPPGAGTVRPRADTSAPANPGTMDANSEAQSQLDRPTDAYGLDHPTPLRSSGKKTVGAIWLVCRCGRAMRAGTSLVGKSVKCRKCGTAVSVPKQMQPTDGPAADLFWLVCPCGRATRVKSSLAGKNLKCRKCGTSLPVPQNVKPAETAANSTDATASSISFRELASELPALTKGSGNASERKRTLSRMRFRRLSKTIRTADISNADGLARCKRAVEELARSGDIRAAELVIGQLDQNSPSLKTSVVNCLAELGDPQATAPLLGLLDEEDLGLKRTVLKALGRIGDRRVVKPLLIFGISDPHLKYLVSEAVLDIGEAAVPVLLDALNSDDPAVVLESVVLLGRLRAKRAVKALIMILETHSGVMQAHAAEALGHIQDARAAASLCRLLESENAGVRVCAADALAKIAEPSSARSLMRALDDSDTDVRKYAATALGEIGDGVGAETLCRMLSSEDDGLRIAAAEALGKIGDERAVEPLLQLLATNSEEMLLKAVGALRRISNPRATEALINLLGHPQPRVRQRAADSLGQIGDSVATDHLENLLRTDRHQDVRASAAKALGAIGDATSMDALIEALRDEFSIRCQAVVALGRIGDEAALPAVLAMLKDSLPEIRYHAAGALAEINRPNAIAPLRSLLDDENPMVRRGVEKALERLAKSHPGASTLARPGGRFRSLARKTASLLTPWQLALLIPRAARSRAIVGGTLAAGLFLAALLHFGPALAPGSHVVSRGRVASLAFSADSRLLAVGRTRGLIEVWETEEGKFDTRFNSDLAAVRRIAYGPDSETLVLSDGATTVLWKSSGDERWELSGHHSLTISIQTTPDGKTVATLNQDGTIVLWDAAAGTQTAAIGLHADNVTAFAISPDGGLVAAGDSVGRVGVWNAQAESVHKFSSGKGKVGALAFSPDGSRLAAGMRGGFTLVWDVETETTVGTLSSERPLDCGLLRFLGSSSRLLCVRGQTAEVWDLESQEPTRLPPPGAEVVTAFAVSADGKWLALSGEQDSAVWLYDLSAGKLSEVLNVSR